MLAEFVARCRDIPMTLGLLLHQGLLHYAGHLSQSVRAGWQKIEGRFRTIQHTDHSKEIYRLIAEVLADRAPTQTVPRSRAAEIATGAKTSASLPISRKANWATCCTPPSRSIQWRVPLAPNFRPCLPERANFL